MRKIQLECIIFRKNKEKYKFLLLKRVREKGGFWQSPCGGLEKNDISLLEASYREISEETGISKKDISRVIKDVHSFEINKNYITGKPIPPIKEYVFGFEVNPKIKISIKDNIHKEHEEFKWVSFENAIKMLKWDNNKDAFNKLKLILDKQ